MRRQYHARPSENGLRCWDVHRLIELSQSLPIEEVPLTEIRELDEDFWFSGDSPPTCRAISSHARLIQETDLRHPIILSADGRVMDGMHRVCKALLQGHATVKARRFRIDPTPDYINVPLDQLPYDEPW